MLRLLLVSSLVALALGKNLYWNSRIVGGSEASPDQFPYQVSLRSNTNVHYCGGTIINNRWILSASHCTIGRSLDNVQVVVGSVLMSGGGIVHQSIAIITHPEYDVSKLINDVAVVQTATTIIFTAFAQPISVGSEYIGAGVLATATGWGTIGHPGGVSPDNLHFVQLATITNEDCRSRHSDVTAAFIFDSTLCSLTRAGEGICFGDSGGPLAVSGQVIGIGSWAIACANGLPDSWTRVSHYRTWIENAISLV